MNRWRPGEPIPVPIRRVLPDPPPGVALLYVDALTGEPMVARRGTLRRRLAETAAATPSTRTARATLELDSIAGGLVSATVAVAGARLGALAQVGYGADIPAHVVGAPFARVTAADTVTVTVPLRATLGAVSVPVIVTVAL